MERAYGRFERAVPLPCAVDDERARDRYKSGVLQVSLPKREQRRRSRIAVNG